MSLIQELKKRNVFRVAVFYLVSSWVILQVGSLLFDIMELPPSWKKMMLVLLVIGFPVALIVSWVFEVTPDGIKRESEIDDADARRSKSGRRMSLATIVVVLLGIAFLGADRYFAPKDRILVETAATSSFEQSERNSIPIVAVLPFLAKGSDDGGFLASGLHDDLLTRLARLNAFRVISRTSMMEYANTTKNMKQIGQELGAGYILEGGVQAHGVRVRINAQLIDAENDQHLWAETYDRELTAVDLFDIQAELARAIARELSLTLSGTDSAQIDRVSTENLVAYYAYLNAMKLRDEGGHNAPTSALVIEALERSVQADPDFAEAWAQLSIEHSRYHQTLGRANEHGPAALEARARANALNPELPEGIVADAVYQYRVLNEYQAALDRLNQLAQTGPLPALVVQLKSFLLRRLGNSEEAYHTMVTAHKLDPLSVSIANQLIEAALGTGRCDAAKSHVAAALALSPDSSNIRTASAVYEMSCTGNLERAEELMKSTGYLEPYHFFTAIRVAESRSDFEWKLELSEIGTRYVYLFPELSNLIRADALVALGRVEEAAMLIESLEQKLFDDSLHDAGPRTAVMGAMSKLQFERLRRDPDQMLYWMEKHRSLFRRTAKGDNYFEQSHRVVYAEALAELGLKDEAVAELTNYFERPSAYPFLYIDIHPVFSVLTDHPGYEALRARYSISD